MLRHTYVSPANQRQFGHATITLTVTQGKGLPARVRTVVDRLDDRSGSEAVTAGGTGTINGQDAGT